MAALNLWSRFKFFSVYMFNMGCRASLHQGEAVAMQYVLFVSHWYNLAPKRAIFGANYVIFAYLTLKITAKVKSGT